MFQAEKHIMTSASRVPQEKKIKWLPGEGMKLEGQADQEQRLENSYDTPGKFAVNRVGLPKNNMLNQIG